MFREPALETAQIDRMLASGHTLPARFYADPEVYRLELDRIFARSWHLVARRDRLAKAGDHVVSRAGTVPVLVTAGRDGALHGLVNVCRHRGHPVATADGCRKTLQCPYHGWTYDLDGSLRSAPRLELEPGFDTSSLGLLPVAVDQWRDWVFVNPDRSAPPLAAVYPELEPLAAERGFDLRAYRYVGRRTYEVAANWKAWVDNAIECYHCPTVHRSSYSVEFHVEPESYDLVNAGRVMAQFTAFTANGIAARRNGELPAAGAGPDFRFFYLWPSSFLVQDRYVGFSGTVVSTGPESSQFVADTYLHPDAPADLLEQWLDMWTRTLEEDKGVVAMQQPGLASGLVEYGRLTTTESAIRHFHRLTWEALAPDAAY